MVLGLVLTAAAAVSLSVLPLPHKESPPSTPWQSCLVALEGGSYYPSLLKIPANTYQFPALGTTLSAFLHLANGQDMVTAAPFLIQAQEVTLDEFKKYAQFVEHLADAKEKDRLKTRLGLQWERGDQQSSSVSGVSWEAAQDYAQWLSQRTGCTYDLPSKDQWAAAAIFLHSQTNVPLDGANMPEGPLKNLLWGVREWSRSPCETGYYLLGEDDWTMPSKDSKDICMPAMFSVAGFRLVLSVASVSAQQHKGLDVTTPSGKSIKLDAR